MADYSYNFSGTPGSWGGSFNFPSFQSMFGQSLPDLLSFLTQQKLALQQPQLTEAGRQFDVSQQLSRELPGIQSTAQLQLLQPQLASEKFLAELSGRQALEQMREQSRLAEQAAMLADLRKRSERGGIQRQLDLLSQKYNAANRNIGASPSSWAQSRNTATSYLTQANALRKLLAGLT